MKIHAFATDVEREFVVKEEEILETIYLEPRSGVHKRTLIWLHGYDQSGRSQLKYFQENDKPIADEFTRVVLLNAPKIPALLNDVEKRLRCWISTLCTIDSFSYTRDLLEATVIEEAKLLNEDYSKIFLGGFSQGGCVAAGYAFCNLDFKFAGVIIACSFYHPHFPITRRDIPLLIVHGRQDPVVPELLACQSYKHILVKNNVPFEYQSLRDARHDINSDGRAYIGNWIKEVSTHGHSLKTQVTAKL